MTFLLRRKHRTTARGRNTRPRMVASVLGLGLALGGAALWAREVSLVPPGLDPWRADAGNASSVLEVGAPIGAHGSSVKAANAHEPERLPDGAGWLAGPLVIPSDGPGRTPVAVSSRPVLILAADMEPIGQSTPSLSMAPLAESDKQAPQPPVVGAASVPTPVPAVPDTPRRPMPTATETSLPVMTSPAVPSPAGPSALAVQEAPPMPRAPRGRRPGDEEGLGSPGIQLETPGRDVVFRRESESRLQERMRQERRDRDSQEHLDFPPEPVLSRESYSGRQFSPMTEPVEPQYVCYGRLYFEQINSERYTWDLGFIHPFVSAGRFFWDVAVLPYKLGTDPCRHFECSAGYCLPGDPVPLLLYPPELSLTGAIFEAGTIVALYAIFPG